MAKFGAKIKFLGCYQQLLRRIGRVAPVLKYKKLMNFLPKKFLCEGGGWVSMLGAFVHLEEASWLRA